MAEDFAADESQLIQRVLAGDQSALADLYARYGGAVFSVALRVLNNRALAEEVTQDTFLKVWSQAHTWDSSKGRLSSWLLTIARYGAIDLLRKEQRRPGSSAVDLDDILNMVGRRAPMDDPQWHDGRLLRALLQQLPSEQSQVIELTFYQGMTHTDMAEHLQLPLGTVKTRVRLGLQKLRDLWLEALHET
jgi:RNA polymerase sigma-70 factor, ECF subfamily